MNAKINFSNQVNMLMKKYGVNNYNMHKRGKNKAQITFLYFGRMLTKDSKMERFLTCANAGSKVMDSM